MKHIKAFIIPFFLLLCVQTSFSAIPVAEPTPPGPKALKKEQQRLIMEQIVKLTPHEYGVMRGKKLNFFERLTFKATQKRMKLELQRADGTFSNFNAGGFFLGFLLGILGVLGAYIFSKDDNFRKWSWIGFGAAVVFYLLFFVLL